jgi:hypothetical protein
MMQGEIRVARRDTLYVFVTQFWGCLMPHEMAQWDVAQGSIPKTRARNGR